MLKSRRKFIQNSLVMSCGFSLISYSESIASIKSNVVYSDNLCKNNSNLIKISGVLKGKELKPLANAIIEICHNNTEKDENIFEYEGKILTNCKGEYQFMTNFPEQHFEDGLHKMRRIFFKIKAKNAKETSTKLYLGTNGEAFIDNLHFEMTHKDFNNELPETKKINENLTSIQFNIFLNL